MKLVYCMAGIYARFRNAGYTTPKFLLPWADRPVLEHILSRMYDPALFDDVVLVANERDAQWAEQIRAVLARFQIPGNRLRFVPDTRGQAETAQIGANHWAETSGFTDDSIVFHNIDTVIGGRDFGQIRQALREADGYIDVFDAHAPIYSYVRIHEDGRSFAQVTEIAEKVVISRHATTGLYGFGSIREYLRLAERTQFRGEFYISDVYKQMLAESRRILANPSSEGHETVIIGTPQEYESLTGRGP